jgi:MFS family permease
MTRVEKLVHNNVLLQRISFLGRIGLTMGIIVPFFFENNLTMSDILILQSYYAFFVVFLEVITGYIADHIGSKQSIVIGLFLQGCGYMWYGCSYSFLDMLIAEFVLAVGYSFQSGADDALRYAGNKESGHGEHDGMTAMIIRSVSRFSEGVGVIIGGFIAGYFSTRPTFWLYGCVLWIAMYYATRLEPPRHERPHENVFRICLLYMKHPVARLFILYDALCSTCTMSVVWFFQPFAMRQGIVAVDHLSLLSGVFFIGSAIISVWMKHHIHALSKKTLCIIMPMLSLGSIFLMAYIDTIWGIIIIFGNFVSVILRSYLNTYLNDYVADQHRATVNSLPSFLFRLMYGVLTPIMAYMTVLSDIRTTLLVTSVGLSVIVVIFLILLKKRSII